MVRINYVSAVFDGSGYGAASRGYIHALYECGADVTITPVSFEQSRPDLGEEGRWLRALEAPGTAPCDLRIIHTTPDLYPSIISGMSPARTIGYSVWETDRLPPGWAANINAHCDQLWVPSSQNCDAFKNSGVTIPIHRVPHCFKDQPAPEARVLAKTEDFRFLSVFQWHERKNPIGLLKAYLTEFRADEKVSLVLKTYLRDSTAQEKDAIKGYINEIKRGLYLPSFPKIELIVRVMSGDDLRRLYHDTDAFVLLSRNEGFGIPIAEAMIAASPVVTTDYGGPSDFVETGHGFLIPYQLTPAFGMPWATYTGAMTWADPDVMAARRAMRALFSDRDGAKLMGLAGRTRTLANLSYEVVGKRMLELAGAR